MTSEVLISLKELVMNIDDAEINWKHKASICYLIDRYNKKLGLNNYDFSNAASMRTLLKENEEDWSDESYLCSLIHLYSYFPDVILKKCILSNGESSLHTSDGHFACTGIESNIGIVPNILLTIPPSHNSCYLRELSRKKRKNTPCTESFEYSFDTVSEVDIQSAVASLFKDLLKFMNLNSDYIIRREISLTSTASRPHADLLVFRQANDYQIACICEVKLWTSKNVMQCERVFGQCYDYLMTLKTYYGIDCPFLILTTLTKWRILWLRDADNYARSELRYVEGVAEELHNSEKRVVCMTKEFAGSDANATAMLTSAIYKGIHSATLTRSLFDVNQRVLSCSDRRAPHWVSVGAAVGNQLSAVRINSHIDTDAVDCIVLRYAVREWEVIVLGLIGVTLCVIKLYANDGFGAQKRDKECEYWMNCNGVNTLKRQLLSRPALVMPFIVCFNHNGEYCSSIVDWCTALNISMATASDETTEQLNRQIVEIISKYNKNCQDAFNDAKQSLLDNYCFHGDVKPTNLGIIEVGYGSVKAVFIDFEEAVKIEKSEDIASRGEAMDLVVHY